MAGESESQKPENVVQNKKKDQIESEMSEEDRILKESLELLVTRVCEPTQSEDDLQIQRNALEALRKEIRSSTTSMTSVPKPLKFLRPHYPKLKTHYVDVMPKDHANKAQYADVLSILAMTLGNDQERDSLRFRLEGTKDSVGAYGHEYVRNLAGELSREYAARKESSRDTHDLSVPFLMF